MLHIEFWCGVSCIDKWLEACAVPSIGHQLLLGNPLMVGVVSDVFWRSPTSVQITIEPQPLSIVGSGEVEDDTEVADNS